MKVFISHKQEDAPTAQLIYSELRRYNVDAYLDLLDASVSGNGEELTNHIRNALNNCTDILVVMSEKTRYSQWVPFEIGMAAECYMPTVTYLQKDVALPEFLNFWPRLKTTADLLVYINARRDAAAEIEQRYQGKIITAESRKRESTNLFYSKLKLRLRLR